MWLRSGFPGSNHGSVSRTASSSWPSAGRGDEYSSSTSRPSAVRTRNGTSSRADCSVGGFDVVAISLLSPLEREDAPAGELDLVDVGRELEVRVQRAGGAVGVARRAGVEQLVIELRVPVLRRAARAEQHRPVPLAAVPGGTDQAQQPARARRLVEREM